MAESRILRVHKRQRYAIIDRRTADDPKLSLKAKGVLLYLLSKPDSWVTNITDIVNHCTDGDYAVRTALKELMQEGYITRIVIRDRRQRIVRHEYIVRELPDMQEDEYDNRDNRDNDAGVDITQQAPLRDYPLVENRAHSNNESSINESTVNLPAEMKGKPPKPEPHAGVDFFKHSFGIKWVNPAMHEAIVRLCELYGDDRFADAVKWAAYRRIPSSKALPAIATAMKKSPEGSRTEEYRETEPSTPASDIGNDEEFARLLASATDRGESP